MSDTSPPADHSDAGPVTDRSDSGVVSVNDPEGRSDPENFRTDDVVQGDDSDEEQGEE